jgi:two-component system, response regulator PdtaR
VTLRDFRKPHNATVVMVVEDEFLIRIDVADELRTVGYTVVECGSADEALDQLHSGMVIDALFTDVRMPGVINGLELARLVQEEWLAAVVIVTSAELPPKHLSAPFISKPYKHAVVVAAIERSLAT